MADKRSVFSLNLGSQRVGAATFSLGKGGVLVIKDFNFTEILGDPAADASRVKQLEVAVDELVGQMKLAKSPIHWAMAGQSVFTRFVKLPPLGNENVDKLVAFEAQQNVPFPMNEVVWDYQFVGESKSEGVEVVLVAIKEDALNEYNDVVEDSSMRTEIVDVAPLALYNAFRYNYADVEKPSLVIDIGARSTNLIFFDGQRAFTRNIPVGGAMITSNIAKEFRLPFAKAEEKKIKSGFVALGGAYADHEDPEIAAMSKVIRNTLSRLQAEIGRTTSFYKSQQGGRAPELIYLAGGCSGLPYIKEFFKEKQHIPIEYFNALRNISLAPELDSEKAARNAHSLGELVGLALRGIGSCPMELDLVPDDVMRRRDITKRKPYLILFTFSLFALLIAGVVYFKKGAQIAEERSTEARMEHAQLGKVDRDIMAVAKEKEDVDLLYLPLREAVGDRSIWLQILSDMNSRLINDLIWLVEIEPLSGENSVTPALSASRSSQGAPSEMGAPSRERGGRAAESYVDTLRVRGLYRQNQSGEAVVYGLLGRLAESEFFDLADYEKKKSEIVVVVETGVSGEPRWAHAFEFKLPLKRRIRMHGEKKK